jgi:DNA polymerase-3 subunit delta
LKNYINNPSDNYLVLVASKVSDKKEIKELLSNNIEIIDSGISSEVLVKNNLGKFKMENRTVKFLVSYCLGNNEKILNELEKIKQYKFFDNNDVITTDDIEMIAIKEYDDDIFDLVNAIVRKEKKKSFDIYFRLMKKEKDIINIVASVSSQIRLLYSVKILSEKRMSVESMAKMLNVKTRAVSIALENCYNFSEKKLLYLLNELADIDFKSKSGSYSNFLLFRNFLINI